MRYVVDWDAFTQRMTVFVSDVLFKDSLFYVPRGKEKYAINPA